MSSKQRSIALAALCLCAFAVNLDVTLVNVTLPRLTLDLGASTTGLQWIVDAYTLTFAALVLPAGSIGDRFGRRGTLIAGLLVYGVGNLLGGLVSTTGALTATRALMGVGAALIFPTTLSIISNLYTERAGRARAIGLWGAVTGLAIALGPIAGGALLEASGWQATFLAKVPVAIVAIVLVARFVPTSRNPEAPRLDLPGLGLSAVAVGAAVVAIIEAPSHGWLSAETLGLFAAAVALAGVFVWHERRTVEPMLDVRIFANARFSAASLAVTISFFALSGFIFLITQYFQFLKGYAPLETGLRLLPVATFVALGSIAGTQIAVRRGTKLVVGGGLGLLAVAYAWVSTGAADTSYTTIAGQMVLLGSGMGLTSAPATESIMGAVSRARAGVGSAINDATRELGGTLGVAVIGSVYASLYTAAFTPAGVRGLPAGAVEAAEGSIGAAFVTAGRLAQAGEPAGSSQLGAVASSGFFDGLQAGCLVAAGVCAAGAVIAFVALPAQPEQSSDAVQAGAVPAPATA